MSLKLNILAENTKELPKPRNVRYIVMQMKEDYKIVYFGNTTPQVNVC